MERNTILETIMLALDTALANVHTATVAVVTSVGTTTISCRPVINRVVDGTSVALPEFVEVPPVFLSGGSSYLAHPIRAGDYCLLVFTERCFDRWYAGQDFQPPLEMRMHDYSDGFAIVGIQPLNSAITIPQETTMTGVTRMGVEAPTDDMALAQKVLDELDAIKAQFDALKLIFDAHVHSSSGAGAPTSVFPAPAVPGSVASAYVKAD